MLILTVKSESARSNPIIHVSPRNLFHEKGITLDQYYVCLDVMENIAMAWSCCWIISMGLWKHLNKEAWKMAIVLELFLTIRWNWKQIKTDRNIWHDRDSFLKLDTFRVKTISPKVGTWSGLLLKVWYSQKHANCPRHFVRQVALMGDIQIFGDLQFQSLHPRKLARNVKITPLKIFGFHVGLRGCSWIFSSLKIQFAGNQHIPSRLAPVKMIFLFNTGGICQLP